MRYGLRPGPNSDKLLISATQTKGKDKDMKVKPLVFDRAVERVMGLDSFTFPGV